MPERTKYFNYNGLSHFQQTPQKLHLMTDTARRVCATVTIQKRQVGAIREAMNALMNVLKPGFEYKSTGKGEINYDTRADNLAVSRNRFFSTITKTDPDAVLGMDPTVTISKKGILFEGLSMNGLDIGTVFIPSSSYTITGDFVSGTSTVEAGPDLVQGLLQITAKQSLEICIGAVANGEERYIGSVKKDIAHRDGWKRDILQFLASSTLVSNVQSRFLRIDVYNVLRHLRLHASDEPTLLRFVLINGLNPEMHLEPWGVKVVSPAGVYRGKRSASMNYYDQGKLARLEPLLPYISHVDVSIMGEALPVFWTLNSEEVSYTYATLGYKPSNWARGLYRDQIIRRDTPNPAEMDNVLAVLKASTYATLDELVAQTGLERGTVQNALLRGVQNGLVAPNAGVNGYLYRSLFMDTSMDDLKYGGTRGGYKNETKAYEIVSQDRVNMEGKIHVKPNGSVDFARLVRTKVQQDVSYSTEPVSVSQEKKVFQTEDPVFFPKLQLNVLGATRKPGCTCAYMDIVGKGAICSHIQALWMYYCREHILGESTGIRSLAQNILVKVENGSCSGHRICIRGRRIIDEWGTMDELNRGKPERRVRLYQRQEDAYQAFVDRIAELEDEGFTNAD